MVEGITSLEVDVPFQCSQLLNLCNLDRDKLYVIKTRRDYARA
jgi:hypothetical protein